MRANPTAGELFDEALNRSGDLPAGAGIETALHYFLGALNGMELQTASRLRDEIANHFGGRYCSSKTCSMMAELISGHLAVRQEHTRG